MPPITLYTQPGCPACELVKGILAQHDVAFAERDIRADPDALAAVQAMGALSTPVTVIGETVIIGYNRRKLDAALTSLAP